MSSTLSVQGDAIREQAIRISQEGRNVSDGEGAHWQVHSQVDANVIESAMTKNMEAAQKAFQQSRDNLNASLKHLSDALLAALADFEGNEESQQETVTSYSREVSDAADERFEAQCRQDEHTKGFMTQAKRQQFLNALGLDDSGFNLEKPLFSDSASSQVPASGMEGPVTSDQAKSKLSGMGSDALSGM